MRIALIDADFIPYICCHVKEKEHELYPAGKPFWQICNDIDSYIVNLLNEVSANHYIGAITKGKCFRYDIYPEYKANRKDKTPMPFIKLAKDYMMEQWKFISYPDLEADDIVNIIKSYYGNELSFIISPDKDLLALEGVNYNPNKKEWKTVEKPEALHKFWTSVITGDTADNIKGIPGKGPAYVKKISEKEPLFAYNVLCEYINHFGEHIGIEEFYKNYKCLKILEKYEGFDVPEPIEFKPILPM